jgi:hypothetical protein
MKLGHFDYLLEEPEPFEKTAVAPAPQWSSKIARDLTIIKETGDCGFSLGMTMRTFDYLDRICADEEMFDKIAAVAIQTDMAAAAAELDEVFGDLSKEASVALRSLALELVKTTLFIKEAVKLPGRAGRLQTSFSAARKLMFEARKGGDVKKIQGAEHVLQSRRVKLQKELKRKQGRGAVFEPHGRVTPERKTQIAAQREQKVVRKRQEAAIKEEDDIAAQLGNSRLPGTPRDLSGFGREIKPPTPVAPAIKPFTPEQRAAEIKKIPGLSSAERWEQRARSRSHGRTDKKGKYIEGGAPTSTSSPTTQPTPAPTAAPAPPPWHTSSSPPGAPAPRHTSSSPSGAPAPRRPSSPAVPTEAAEGLTGMISKFNKQGWGSLTPGEKTKLIGAGVATVAGHRILTGRDLVSGDKGGGGSGRRNVVIA